MKYLVCVHFYKLVLSLQRSSIRTWSVASSDAVVGSFQHLVSCWEGMWSINSWWRDSKSFDSLRKGKKNSPRVVLQILSIHRECFTRSQVYSDSFYSIPYVTTCLNLKSGFIFFLTYTFLCCCCTEGSRLFSMLARCSTKSRVSAVKAKHAANLGQAYKRHMTGTKAAFSMSIWMPVCFCRIDFITEVK